MVLSPLPRYTASFVFLFLFLFFVFCFLFACCCFFFASSNVFAIYKAIPAMSPINGELLTGLACVFTSAYKHRMVNADTGNIGHNILDEEKPNTEN